MKIISVIVPCFNEEESLGIFYKTTLECISKISNYNFEFVFVDDGSTDNTLAILEELSKKDSRILYFSFSRNFGKESAMYAGLKNASGDFAVFMDADLQDPPSLLPEMINAIENEGYDCVATRRVERKGEPVIRSFFARRFYKLINKISDIEIMDGARDFRLMTRQVVDSILELTEYHRFSKGIFDWIGYKTKWIDYQNLERVAGTTKWSFWKLFKYAIEGIVAFTTMPLKVASFFGMIISLISFISLVFVVVRRLIFGDPVGGWASIVSILLAVSGIQLICVGVMGEYLSKTYMETKRRPLYFIKSTNKKARK
ncbi:glycosyltransferase family 2 protein [Herbivorax sp. ANBcel31]|uniref:glycosyltransferase family 2 protein n=1 Tax=Herbivorax sp. ANBcel31 TaxID=3069754 RepID=UPI0027B07B40|nr:glycosyltransferase family 2 protein [Herbivorax sp. ANBcel31]MDQ2084835.1 glycosyltransferase family 2 protein [Herbivorax sp. ANBcel31]